MATVSFTPNLERHVECPTKTVEGSTVRDVLDRVFADNPLRHHMLVFVDGQQIADRERLSDPVSPGSELYVMQSLSGG